MMCCNECPFNPECGSADVRCSGAVCSCSKNSKNLHEYSIKSFKSSSSKICSKSVGARCFMDYYVLNNLGLQDKLAVKLLPFAVHSALISRDRPFISALFYVAPKTIRKFLWSCLNLFETRSLSLLNPLFVSSGLESLESTDVSEPFINLYSEAAAQQKTNKFEHFKNHSSDYQINKESSVVIPSYVHSVSAPKLPNICFM